jgi:hypothetical protein
MEYFEQNYSKALSRYAVPLNSARMGFCKIEPFEPFSMMPQQQYMRFVWKVLCLAALSSGFGGAAAAQTAPRPSLTVTPSSAVSVSGPEGGPFSPSSIHYRLSASTGTIRFAITVPFWLRADPRIGTVGTDSVIVTLQLNPQAKLSPQAYEAPVTFINVTNGQGTTRRTAKLTVEPSSTGYLRDNSGGYLLDDRGQRLLAR